MDGCTCRSIDEWMDGGMMNGWMGGWMNGLVGRCTWMIDKWMGGWKERKQKIESRNKEMGG